jgi:hypothetical protein
MAKDDDIDEYFLVLKEMKGQENNYIESILILMDDSALRNSVIAWQTIKCVRIPRSNKNFQAKCPYTLTYDKWNWLWGQTQFDQKHFAKVSKVRENEVNDLYIRMTALRLIYPDNSISQAVKGLLRNTIKTKFPQPKETKPSIPPKE